MTQAAELSRQLADVLAEAERLEELGVNPLMVQAIKLEVDAARRGWLER